MGQGPWELGLREACPSLTAAHPSPASVLLQALLGRLTLEWDSGVHWWGEHEGLGSPDMAKYATRSGQREYCRRGGAFCVCL